MSEEAHVFKCLLLGFEKAGKTAFVRRHVTGEFQKSYKPNNSVRISPLTFHTNIGPIRFNIWDISPGAIVRDYQKEAYYSMSHCAILMFDVSNFESYIYLLQKVYKPLKTTCRNYNFTIVLCGNKSDIRKGKIRPVDVMPFTKSKIPYFESSVKYECNMEMPFVIFARKLLKNENISLVDMPALFPPALPFYELAVDSSARKKIDEVLDKAKVTKLPESTTIL